MTVNNSFSPDQVSPLAGILAKAKNRQMSLTDLFQIAESLNGAGQQAQAAELYKTWTAFNNPNPLLHLAYFNYAVVLGQISDNAGAVQALRACLKLDPKFPQGHINLGRALEDAGLNVEAIQQWRGLVDATAEITPEKIGHRLMAIQHIGRVMEGAGLLQDAETTLWQAIELQPDRPEAGQHWTAMRQRQAKWPVLVSSAHVTQRQLLNSMSPLTLACFSDDPMFQFAKAYRYNKSLVGDRPDVSRFPRKPVQQKTGTGQRVRVGYLSSDLREHAVGFALCEMMELHDKASVEVYAYYSGDERATDETQARIKNSIDCWRNITALSDADAALQIRADDIDILIDLNGYTKHARAKIFSYRPAPVIVNYCGFPGSMASPYHQYMIADDIIVPPENEIYFSEKVLRLPCYLPVDRSSGAAPRPTRAEAGLPEGVFVYACLNGMQKITAHCFARWMAILTATPSSVLWLRSGDAEAQERLRAAAQDAGVSPDRLIFATAIAGHSNHIARLGLADLFLDTFPYGAHATATDALLGGLPILTVPGKTFATRVCASIVSAAGLPEMLCHSSEEYVSRAIGFANDPQSLKAIRDKLEKNRDTSKLRDTPALTRRMEELFWQMQGEAERGEMPVPDFRNIELYYELGAEILLTDAEFEDGQSYRRRYVEKLTKWHDYEPIQHDIRLWPEQKS